MEPIDQRVLADFASYAVHFRLIEPARVVAWADSLIAESELPPPWLLDLSLVDQTDDFAVQAALRAVPGTPDDQASIDLVNGLVLREWRDGRLTIGEVRGIGWNLYRSAFDQGDLTQWGVVVECNGEYLDDGLLSEAEMREIIDQQLAPFEPSLQRLPPWV